MSACPHCNGSGRHEGVYGGPGWPRCGWCAGSGISPFEGPSFDRSTGAVADTTRRDGGLEQGAGVETRPATATPEKVEDGGKDCNASGPSSEGGQNTRHGGEPRTVRFDPAGLTLCPHCSGLGLAFPAFFSLRTPGAEWPRCGACGGKGVLPDESERLVPRDAPAWPLDAPQLSDAAGGATNPLPATGSGPAFDMRAPGGAAPLIPQAAGPSGAAPASPVSAGEALCFEDGEAFALPPAVALVWQLVRAHDAGLSANESLARAICAYADKIGVPALARDDTVEFFEVPGHGRVAQNRFRPRAPP